MKSFNIVFYIFIIFLSFLLLSCSESLEEIEDSYKSSNESVLADEVKKIENDLSSNFTKGLIVVPCVEDKFMELLPEELSESEKKEKDKAYSDLVQIVTGYKAELIEELQKFEAESITINKEIEKAELEDITLKGDFNEEEQLNLQKSSLKPLLSKTHLYEVSQEFQDQSLVNAVYASLGYDVRVINKLEKMIDLLDLDATVTLSNEADKQLHDELLSLSYSMLFCLSHITNSAMRITNDYFNELNLFSLSKINFTQKFVDLHVHVSEFIQSRAQFIENIKRLISEIRIDNKQRMLIVLRDLMQDKGEIVSASNFTQRKASIIKCEIDNLLRLS